LKKRFYFSEVEYESIRTELVNRINAIYSQSNTALTTIISTWVAGITLFIFLTGDRQSLPYYAEIVIRLFNSLVFLIPVFFFIPLSIKSGENLTQIASISAYIRVFFEYLNLKSDDYSIPKYGWEISNTFVSDINAFRKNKSKFILRFNDEFTILSIISIIIYFISAGLNILTILETPEGQKLQNSIWIYIILAAYIFFAVISIIILVKIHNSSCVKRNLIDKSPIFIKGYIQRAANLNLISNDEETIDKIFEELNPNKRLRSLDGKEIETK
jgi:hypothetical protein